MTHITVDTKRTRIIVLEITDGKVGDGRMLPTLVEGVSKKAKVTEPLAAHTQKAT